MKWYRDPIVWIILIRGGAVLFAFLLLIWLAAHLEITVNFQ